jgi:hypothetical protein
MSGITITQPSATAAPYSAYGQAESTQIILLNGSGTPPFPENLITFDAFSSVKNMTIDLVNSAINFNADGAYLLGINLNVQHNGNHDIVVYPRINGNNDYYYTQVFNLHANPNGVSVYVGFTMLKMFSAGDNIQFYATTNGNGTSITTDGLNNVNLSVRITANYVGDL